MIDAGAEGPDAIVDAPADTDAEMDTNTGAGAEAASEVELDVDSAPPGEMLSEAQLEALLFVAEKPLTRREIATLAGVDRATVDERLGDLEVALANRGIRLVLSGDRVELVTAPDAGALIARYVGADAVRLSPASLETLAIVAYRQPVTKAAVERIRGVDSDYTIRTLLHRRLVVELGRSEAPGRPFLYGTGFEFLERFGLTSLDELPPLDVELAARLMDEEAATTGPGTMDGAAAISEEPPATDERAAGPEAAATSERAAGPEPAANESAPDESAPDGTAPNPTAPDGTAPNPTAPDPMAANRPAPDQLAPGPMAPDMTAHSRELDGA